MSREEAKKILMVISASYPNYHPSDLTATVNAWFVMLQDYSYKQIHDALVAYVRTDTKGFAPAIGQLIEKVIVLQNAQPLNELEAWGLVYKAICNSTYNAESEFAKLPPTVQRAVGNSANLREMASMDASTVQSVEQSHFVRCYRAELQRSIDEAKVSANICGRLGNKSNVSLEITENV